MFAGRKRYSDFHTLHKQLSALGEIHPQLMETAAFPEKERLSSIFSTRDLVAVRFCSLFAQFVVVLLFGEQLPIRSGSSS